MGNTTVGLYICENNHQPNAELDETLVQVSKRMKDDIQEFRQTQEMFMQKALIELYIKNYKKLTPAAQNHTRKFELFILTYLTLLFSLKREFF